MIANLLVAASGLPTCLAVLTVASSRYLQRLPAEPAAAPRSQAQEWVPAEKKPAVQNKMRRDCFAEDFDNYHGNPFSRATKAGNPFSIMELHTG